MAAAMDTTMTDLATLRLWQLISPALPVGAYAYSAGLESAIEVGHVSDADSCCQWIEGVMTHALGRSDLPAYIHLYDAWQDQDEQRLAKLTRLLQAVRESGELLAEDRQMGAALTRLLVDLDVPSAKKSLLEIRNPSFATAYACACVHWGISAKAGTQALCWSWLENQVAAALKLIPLGQTDGQRILGKLMPVVVSVSENAQSMSEEDIGFSLPGLAMLSANHEQQYSRLFRS